MKIGIIQYSPEWESPENNYNKILNYLNNWENIEMLIFPEMTLTGFTMNAANNSEEVDGKFFKAFLKIASKYKTNIFFGFIEKENSDYFNTLVHFDSSGLIAAKYRKIHLFTMAGENNYYSTSAETVLTKIGKVKIGLSICYDLRFPELYRKYAKEQAEILIDIANWPVKRINHWNTLLKARAIENQSFVIGVNRTGNDPFHQYNGQSACYDPMGNEIFNAGNNEGLFTFEIDLDSVKNIREKLPFLNDIKLI